MESKKHGDGTISAGAAWVERFLLPRLESRFSSDNGISCLQIAPDDETEAQRLRVSGHSCDISGPRETLTLPFPDSSYDFIFTGRFPVLALDDETRISFAKELYRVLRRGGSLLLVLGNRTCPVDLTRNGPLVHGPHAQRTLSFQEARDVLVRNAGFTSVAPQSIFRHFGWGSLPASARWLGGALDAYWRLIVTPERLWLYTSPLNPTLILWLNKD